MRCASLRLLLLVPTLLAASPASATPRDWFRRNNGRANHSDASSRGQGRRFGRAARTASPAHAAAPTTRPFVGPVPAVGPHDRPAGHVATRTACVSESGCFSAGMRVVHRERTVEHGDDGRVTSVTVQDFHPNPVHNNFVMLRRVLTRGADGRVSYRVDNATRQMSYHRDARGHYHAGSPDGPVVSQSEVFENPGASARHGGADRLHETTVVVRNAAGGTDEYTTTREQDSRGAVQRAEWQRFDGHDRLLDRAEHRPAR